MPNYIPSAQQVMLFIIKPNKVGIQASSFIFFAMIVMS